MTAGSRTVDQRLLDRSLEALADGGIGVIGSELDGNALMIRVASNEDQLKGQEILQEVLNQGPDARFVIALTQASTTPAWLEDLGGKPMSLGLDLSGGVHFLLQVDMEKFLGDRMLSNQEAIRDLLVKERLRYANRDWVEGSVLAIAFQDADTRDQAASLIRDQFDEFEIFSRDVEGKPGLRLSVTDEKMRSATLSENTSSDAPVDSM